MGKVIEKVRLTSLFDPAKTREVEAVIDTGATMLVLPQNIINELNLRKMREVKVRYANSKTEIKPIYGKIILEQLDLIVDPSTRKVTPNPRSPEMQNLLS